MGQKAQEPADISAEELPTYLRVHHSVFMDFGSKTYYLTDVNDHFWRVQDTGQLNDKGHFTDITEPVSTLSEFLASPIVDGKLIDEIYPDAVFYASVKPE